MKKAITFYMDEETGELDRVDENPEFVKETPLFRMDILQDIINWCEGLKEESGENFKDSLIRVGELNAPERPIHQQSHIQRWM